MSNGSAERLQLTPVELAMAKVVAGRASIGMVPLRGSLENAAYKALFASVTIGAANTTTFQRGELKGVARKALFSIIDAVSSNPDGQEPEIIGIFQLIQAGMENFFRYNPGNDKGYFTPKRFVVHFLGRSPDY